MSRPKKSTDAVSTLTSPQPVTLHFDQVVAPGYKSVLECSIIGPSCISGTGAATWRHIKGDLKRKEVAVFNDRNLSHVELVAQWIRQLVERQLGVRLDIPAVSGIGITVDSTTARKISKILMRNAKAQGGSRGKPPRQPLTHPNSTVPQMRL